MLAFMPVEVQKHWSKLNAFFNFFLNMVKDGNRLAINYLNKRGLIGRLIDLTGRFNPQQNEYSAISFDGLIQTVCILARSQPMIMYLYGMSDKYQPNIDDVSLEL